MGKGGWSSLLIFSSYLVPFGFTFCVSFFFFFLFLVSASSVILCLYDQISFLRALSFPPSVCLAVN